METDTHPLTSTEQTWKEEHLEASHPTMTLGAGKDLLCSFTAGPTSVLVFIIPYPVSQLQSSTSFQRATPKLTFTSLPMELVQIKIAFATSLMIS